VEENVNPNLKNTFRKYYTDWVEETQFTSSNQAMFENNNYQAIIKMGLVAVPYIIEQLREKPDHLFWALERITGDYPLKPDHVGHLYEMAADWIEWYDTRNIFLEYHQRWFNETKYLSSPTRQYENKYYQMIIKMGWDAVPHIIDSLKIEPSRLLEALSQITNVNPEKPEHLGNLTKMADDWIEWWNLYSSKKE
jgi:hypothetical protein